MTLSEVQSRTRFASMSMKLTICGQVVLLILVLYGIHLFSGIHSDEQLEDLVLEQYTSATVGMYGLALGILLCTAFAFVSWMLGLFDFHQAQGLDHPFGRRYVGWAFFIPFLNLVRPYQVVSSLTTGSLYLTEKEDHGLKRQVLFWWLTYLSGNMFSYFSDRLMQSSDEMDVYLSALWLEAAGTLLSLISAYLILQVIESHDRLLSAGQMSADPDGTRPPEDHW